MKIYNKLIIAGASACLLYTAPVISQTGSAVVLEEIVITGRKREESLQEVPVSISVLGANLISDAGIVSQGDLFSLVPGLQYDEGPDRNAAFPSIRGVQSFEIATNRTKVTSFVDGMPILGSIGAIGFGNASQVEVYRGPQSAAFGRSTFGGAINYVTKDPGENFEASVSLDVNDYGRNLIRGGISGPLSDTIGYLLNVEYEDSTSPDEYEATDGTQYGERGTEIFGGKLVFNPTDALEIELAFSHSTVGDMPNAQYFITEAARDACYADSGVRNNAMMGGGIYADGILDCDWTQGAQIAAQNDRRIQLQNAFDNLTDAFPQYDGLTAQQQDDLLFLAGSQSLYGDNFGPNDTRERFAIQADYQLDSGSAIQFSAFTSEENYLRGNDGSRYATTPINFMATGPSTWALVDMGGSATLGTIMSDPTDISEKYAELRWVSPDDARLRYVVGASYYDYDFLTTLYFGGYTALTQGPAAVARYLALTGDDPSIPDQLLGESASNTGLFFNANYDLSDQLTVTVEGRYQQDDVSGTDTISGNSGAVTTKKFIPRLSFNYNIDDQTSIYGQVARGNNPAGVNVGFFNPAIIASLANANTLYQTSGGTQGVNYTLDDVATFKEETLYNYEVGVKGAAMDNRLQYAAAVYYMTWEGNVQPINLYWGPTLLPGESADAADGNRTFLNNGDSDMKGIEFEGTYLVTNAFSVRATASLLKAKYTDLCDVDLVGGVGDLIATTGGKGTLDALPSGAACWRVDGNTVRQNPEFSGSLSPSYRGDLSNGIGWNARADLRYEGEQWLDVANVAKMDAVATINLSFGLTADNWNATLYVNNLTDNDTPISWSSSRDDSIVGTNTAITGAGGLRTDNILITPRAPRTIGVRLGYNF